MPHQMPVPPPAVVRLAGPPTPPVTGIHRASSAFRVDRAVAAALMEVTGATVVVEGEMPGPLPPHTPSLNVSNVKFRFLGGSWNSGSGPNGPLFVESSDVLAMRGGIPTRSAPIGLGF